MDNQFPGDLSFLLDELADILAPIRLMSRGVKTDNVYAYLRHKARCLELVSRDRKGQRPEWMFDVVWSDFDPWVLKPAGQALKPLILVAEVEWTDAIKKEEDRRWKDIRKVVYALAHHKLVVVSGRDRADLEELLRHFKLETTLSLGRYYFLGVSGHRAEQDAFVKDCWDGSMRIS